MLGANVYLAQFGSRGAGAIVVSGRRVVALTEEDPAPGEDGGTGTSTIVGDAAVPVTEEEGVFEDAAIFDTVNVRVSLDAPTRRAVGAALECK